MQPRPTYLSVLVLTLAAALTTACLSANGLATWADTDAAHAFADTLTRWGITAPAQRLHDVIRTLEEKRFAPAQE